MPSASITCPNATDVVCFLRFLIVVLVSAQVPTTPLFADANLTSGSPTVAAWLGSLEPLGSPFSTYKLPPKPNVVAKAMARGKAFVDLVHEPSVPSELIGAEKTSVVGVCCGVRPPAT